ncbi:MAG: formate/nitrite transporter family protein [Planctomycetes bacterium]|nr:formate/nitrite transporter family protein [Planctomycetota bacterium]
MAIKAEAVGVKKAALGAPSMFALAVLAGAFIAIGALFATTVTAGAGLPFGVSRLLGGVVFSLGLILVIIAGAELFTGNNLIVMAWAAKQVSTKRLLRNWGVVYVGNFVGSIATAALVFLSGQYGLGGGAVGAKALAIADAKCQLEFLPALFLGVLCNALVCLAVWLSFSARSVTDKVMVIVPPIAAFVAAGFEHSVANMYFISLGLLIKQFAPDTFWSAANTSPEAFGGLTWAGFGRNLLPVTLGNILGGSVLVGIVYWFIYLRPRRKADA